MTADYDGESGRFRFEIQLRQIVQHVDGNARHFEDFGQRQLQCPRALVDVAADGGDWGNSRKSFDDLWRAHVAGMDDAIRSAQSFDCFWAQQAVGIGDDADEDASSQFSTAVFSN